MLRSATLEGDGSVQAGRQSPLPRSWTPLKEHDQMQDRNRPASEAAAQCGAHWAAPEHCSA